ncbi:hypothetical protein EDD53_2731 [Pacificibacter maritimus]|uniref:Uncharacterized protein n=1 Tax=Pacificibacter maritimus TaxID=762213 RepID=A0A3N4UR20_9RHOB|nr:hypothetical protein [Pacificibacter maritimus]RPE63134.1 hypothetical protein EDD53_2731 [Pacificibacter maritimus]
MNDFIAKARQNRLRALSSHTNGSDMFFPDSATNSASRSSQRIDARMTKPMFVRSQTSHTGAGADVPRADAGAHHGDHLACNDTFILTEEHAISNVLRMVA